MREKSQAISEDILAKFSKHNIEVLENKHQKYHKILGFINSEIIYFGF